MKFSSRILAANVLAVLFMAASCGEEKKHDSFDKVMASSPSLRLVTEDNQTKFTYGDTISVSVEMASKEDSIKELRVYADDNLVAKSTARPFEFSLPTNVTGGGNVRLRFEASLNKNRSARRIKSYEVQSAMEPATYTFEVVNRYPHDTESFTQGFLIHEGNLYESTGNYGESHIRKIDLESGNTLAEADLSDEYFGEGITVFDNKVYQLTYKSSRGFIYDAQNLERNGEFTYNFHTSEGWGMTSNDTSILASDGSAFIHFCSPEDMSVQRKLRVFDNKGDVVNLNELELVGDTLYANLYTEPLVAKIDIHTGRVVGYIDLRGVIKREEVDGNRIDVLNGIALHPTSGRLLVTGKYWPFIYEIDQKKVLPEG